MMRAGAFVALLAAYFPVAFVAGILADAEAAQDLTGFVWLSSGILLGSIAVAGIVGSCSLRVTSRKTIFASTLVSALSASVVIWAGWLMGYSVSDGYLCADRQDCENPISYIAIWAAAAATTAVPVLLGACAIGLAITRRGTTAARVNG